MVIACLKIQHFGDIIDWSGRIGSGQVTEIWPVDISAIDTGWKREGRGTWRENDTSSIDTVLVGEQVNLQPAIYISC